MILTPRIIDWNLMEEVNDNCFKKLDQHLYSVNYRILPLTQWKWVIKQIPTPSKYYGEFRDCNSFATHFKGEVMWRFAINGVFTVVDSSSEHTFNSIIVDRGINRKPVAKIYDPISGKFGIKGQPNYLCQDGVIL